MIVREYQNGIGWAVDYVSGGRDNTLYFRTPPTDAERDEVISRYEQLQLAEIVAAKRLDEEESE